MAKFIRLLTVILLLGNSIPLFPQFSSPARFDSTFTDYFRQNSGGWTAGDATISIPLSDNRVIWLFGDSYIVDVDTTDNTLPCLFQIRNCMMVQDSVDRDKFTTYTDTNETGIHRTTFKLPGSSQLELLWPNHGFEYQDTVFIFFEHLDSQSWELIDMYVAKLLMPGLQIVQMVQLPDRGNFVFGRCVLTDSVAGYRYIYGNKVNWIVQEPFIARCSLDGLLGLWEYWNGSEWSENIMMIQKISDLPVSPSYSVVKIGARYHLITQENGYLTCGLGRNIYSYESDSPTGPFVNQALLYTEESKIGENYLLTYNAYSHPYFTEDNELLISYNVNDWVDTINPYICPSQCKDVWTDRMDADSYRPKFIRVPQNLITGTGNEINAQIPGNLYPNPAKPGGLVSWNQMVKKDEHVEIIITDLTGTIIRREKQINDLSFYAPGSPGVYLISMIRQKQCNLNYKLYVIP